MNHGPRLHLPLPPATKVLLLVNLAVFAVNALAFGKLGRWFAFSWAGLWDGYGLGLLRVATYQFTHSFQDPLHLLMNMVALWVFGPMAEARLGRSGLVRTYLWAGCCGALGHLALQAAQGQPAGGLIGASGACYGLLVYAACAQPQARIVFLIVQMPLWGLAALLIALGAYQAFVELATGTTGGVSHSAHLGGAVLGFVAYRCNWFADHGSRFDAHRPAMLARWYEALQARSRDRARSVAATAEQRLDAILAKVKAEGLCALRPDERRVLQQASRRAQRGPETSRAAGDPVASGASSPADCGSIPTKRPAMSRLPNLLATVLLFLLAPLPAQDPATDQFRNDFNKGIELADDKLIDKALKRGPQNALNYFEAVYWDKQAGKAEGIAKVDALRASWQRCFEGGDTMEKLERWLNGADKGMQDSLRKSRDQSYKLWVQYNDTVSKTLVKADYLSLMQDYVKLAQNAQQFGHYLEIAELYSFASLVGSKMPDKTIDDRKAVIEAIDGFVEARKAWSYTFDEHFIRNSEFVKAEKQRLEEDQQKGDKKKGEGYSADAKGVEGLVMPGVAAVSVPLKFEAMTSWDELDYGPKGGPVPPFWWQVSLGKEGSAQKIAWFKRSELYLVRTGAAKFALSLVSNDTKDAIEVEAGSKGKVTSFWLDAGKKLPYAMAFWIGTDREMINEAEGNFAASDTLANVYYRSAASWKAQIGADTLTLYDDSANGNPGDTEPLAAEFKSYTLGQPADGTVIPLLDSMRVGKGTRVPHSEFVKLSNGWHHIKKASGDSVTVRPLNPEYMKTAKIKLVWSGPKPTAPAQLVVQGAGDLHTAFFDVAGGKEVEVPAGDYTVIFGRVMIGKAPRVQMASLYQGQSRSFAVAAGKTYELRMGAPFALQFERTGEDTVVIPALKVFLGEASGCVFTDYHGMSIACDVAMAKEGDGKGGRPVGKFLRFASWDLVNEATKAHGNLGLMTACFPMPDGYRSGPLELKLKLPAGGMKLQLSIKKHPVFGEIKSLWQ